MGLQGEKDMAEQTEEELREEFFEGPLSDSMSYEQFLMNKVELEASMREHGIELDRRKSKGDLLEQVDEYFKDNF